MAVLNLRRYGKFIIVVICLVLFVLLGMAGFNLCRLYLSAKVDRSNAMQVARPIAAETLPTAAVCDFFTEYRLERDKLRSERSEVLREVIRGTKSDEVRQKAQEAMLKLVADKEREAEMESMIKAKGFSDALVFIRENAVSAIIKSQNLERDQVVRVAEIICRVGGVKPEDVTISAKP